MILWAAITFICAGLSTAILVPLVRRWAVATGFVDHPGEHRGHETPTPLGGGIAISITIILPLLVIGGVLFVINPDVAPAWLPTALAIHLPGAAAKAPQLLCLAAGLTAVFVVGLIDDRRSLPAGPRLAVHAGVGVLFWACGINITAFVDVPGASLVLTTLWVAGITNAFNLLDNMDGLSSGVAVICCVILAIALSTPPAQLFVIALLLLVAGSAMGFWVHNRPPASIFMGDAGSTVLGCAVAAAAALATFHGEGASSSAHAVALPLLVLAIPIYDTISVVVLRMARGVSPFSGDRNHFSHRLRRLGLSTRATLATVYLATVATGLGALLITQVSSVGAVVLLAQCGLILGMIAILEVAALSLQRESDPGIQR